MPRLVVEKTVMSKILTHFQRPYMADLYEVLKAVRKTEGNKGAVVFWNIDTNSVVNIRATLQRELGWARKPDGCNAERIRDAIKLCDAYLREEPYRTELLTQARAIDPSVTDEAAEELVFLKATEGLAARKAATAT